MKKKLTFNLNSEDFCVCYEFPIDSETDFR